MVDHHWSLPSKFTAEKEGFEPPLRFRKTVFKTVAINHSATSPKQKTLALLEPGFLNVFNQYDLLDKT
jgi:hypothetical protein